VTLKTAVMSDFSAILPVFGIGGIEPPQPKINPLT
jgi:hypothetical protein